MNVCVSVFLLAYAQECKEQVTGKLLAIVTTYSLNAVGKSCVVWFFFYLMFNFNGTSLY